MFKFTEAKFNRLFPFFILLDEELKIVKHGSSLPVLLEREVLEEQFFNCFNVFRPQHFPKNFEGLSQEADVLVILEIADKPSVKLRGQLELIPETRQLLFVGTPWFSTIEEVRAQQLNMTHFAIHDPLMDLMMVVQMQKITTSDVRDMLQTILQQKATLKRLNLILEETENGVVVTDIAGTIEWCNKGYEKLTGFCGKEIVGKKPGHFLQGKDSDPLVVAYLRTQISKVENFGCELINYRKDGNAYWVKISGQPLYDEKGNHSGFYAIQEDITLKKQQQDKLDQQRAFYENVLNNIPADIAVFNNQHQYIFVNEKAVINPDIRSWIIGRNDFEYVKYRNKPIELAEKRKAIFEETIATNKTVEFEDHFVLANGKSEYNLRRFHPLKNKDGNIDYVVAYGININELKQKQVDLEKSEANFKKLLNNLNEAVITVDSMLVITFANPIWTDILGFSVEESKGSTLSVFFEDEICQQLLLLLEAPPDVTAKRNVRKAAGFTTQQGEVKYLDLMATPSFNMVSHEPEIMLFISDVSDQVYAQKQLQVIADKERNMNELKSSFLNMVSHELRTPLAIIQSSIELLSIEMERGFLEKKHIDTELENVTAEIDRMVEIMNELLLLGKTEAEKLKLKPQLSNVTDIVGGIVERKFNPWEDGRKCVVQYKGLKEELLIDHFATSRLLINVLENAFKYSPNSTDVKVNIRIEASCWCIVVVDNGIGISQKDLGNMFTSFRRGGNVGKIPGTGIGMVLVHYFLQMIKGDIHIKSKLGSGTCVYIKLPKVLI